MEAIIKLTEITKKFKDRVAVDQVSTVIEQGELVAILGPNGAGKSTTIMMMLGLLEPSSGKVEVFQSHPKEKRVRSLIGAMLQEVSIIDALTVKEVIQLFRSYYPAPMSFDELVNLTGLEEKDLSKRAEKLSGGQKRRLSFALALAGDPYLLFFDEPTVGMDTISRKRFWLTIQELNRRGKTIIFTTHYLQEADDIAKRILLFNEGKIIEDGTPADIKRKLTVSSVSFVVNDLASLAWLKSLPYVTKVVEKDGRIYVETEQTDEVLTALFAGEHKVRGIEIHRGRLDEAYEQLTRKDDLQDESSIDAM
ncbi:ABC transporter ATP-binding protein [Cytobacillus purgationiresistens]|uniref:ABC-2 type transport system ATP-binding protein n=1 Tax=Cytobacillus purgationiresistens TaxID=863449 RepID=A0ABU0ABM2_9BACI|nr:ABC transporter ATP-binding protein [Cytobacillus purgationiresistens]MDQ0268652.1 ABC-2 type transport system ATP-binding protein [Cytobacillus purgationiresistens]